MEHLLRFLSSTATRPSALAATVGITRGYMSELATGKKRPGLDLAFKLQRATAGAVPAECWLEDEGELSLDQPSQPDEAA